MLAQGRDVATMRNCDRWRQARKLRVRSMTSKRMLAVVCVASLALLRTVSVLVPPTPDLCPVPGGFWQDPTSIGLALGFCVVPLEGHMVARPLQEHGQDGCLKRSILGDQMSHLQFQCKPSSLCADLNILSSHSVS